RRRSVDGSKTSDLYLRWPVSSLAKGWKGTVFLNGRLYVDGSGYSYRSRYRSELAQAPVQAKRHSYHESVRRQRRWQPVPCERCSHRRSASRGHGRVELAVGAQEVTSARVERQPHQHRP